MSRNPLHHEFCNCICTDKDEVIEALNKISDIVDLEHTWKETPTLDQIVAAIQYVLENYEENRL